MPAIHGILETALYVQDVPRAATFYQRLFGFEPLLESERLVALAVARRDVLLLFKSGGTAEPWVTPGGVVPGHGAARGGNHANHFAFSIAADEFAAWLTHLESQGVAIESTVTWEGGAQSIYFRDPDQNLVELMTPGFWRVG